MQHLIYGGIIKRGNIWVFSQCQKLYTARKKFTPPSEVPVATKTMTGARMLFFFRVTIYLAVEVKFCGIFVTFLPLLFFWGNWIERVWKFDTFGPQPHNDLGFTVCQKLSLSNKQNHNPSPFETLFRTKSWITLGTCFIYTNVRFFSRIMGDISLCRIAKVETEKLKISFPSLLEFVPLSVIFVWSSKLTSANKFIHGDIGKLDTHFCDKRNNSNTLLW